MSTPAKDPDVIRAELAASAGSVFYSDLAAHVKRDAVLLVARELSIVECAVAIATDDVSAVSRWVESGALRKPTLDERAEWSAAVGRRWTTLVVQPYVLAQDLAD